jgi:hypothetical protein
MRTRTIVTTIALGVCLGLSTVPAQAALTVNGASIHGLSQNGEPIHGLSLKGWINGFTLQPTSGAQVSSPDVPGDRLPFQSISQQGLGKR